MAQVVVGRGQARLFVPAVAAMLRLGEWGRRQKLRASCGPLSEAMLRDIGLTRDDVEAALVAPLDQDASDHLASKAMARAGNW